MAKVGLVVLLAIAVLSLEYGRHTRTGMMVIIVIPFVDVA